MALTRQASLLTGAEFRYIRSAGKLLSQPALGKLMGIDGQSVARWEKTSKVPRWADNLSNVEWLPLFSGQSIVAKIVAADRAVVGTDLAATPRRG
jgi:hypothetical protein